MTPSDIRRIFEDIRRLNDGYEADAKDQHEWTKAAIFGAWSLAMTCAIDNLALIDALDPPAELEAVGSFREWAETFNHAETR